ncbi:DnaJ domain-containing protein [Alphaproteobacteria bacterium]|jgi:curved DNA-binding protein CbpA|nr:DnaJ domain-containing protein [Alphaproteobacteria bacterium]
MDNFYDILGVSQNAEIEVIKAAHKALAKKYHPDTYSGNKKKAEEKLKSINAAFDVLSNSKKRKEYDEKIKSNDKQTGFDDKSDFNADENGEPVLKEDWQVLIEVFPEAEDMRKQLSLYSPKLSFTYQINLLTFKGAINSVKTGKQLKKDYFRRHFGTNRELHNVVELLLLAKKRHIAKEINRKVALLGSASSERIIIDIEKKHKTELEEARKAHYQQYYPYSPDDESKEWTPERDVSHTESTLVLLIAPLCILMGLLYFVYYKSQN